MIPSSHHVSTAIKIVAVVVKATSAQAVVFPPALPLLLLGWAFAFASVPPRPRSQVGGDWPSRLLSLHS